jgi:CheY-like chemotaxis protein
MADLPLASQCKVTALVVDDVKENRDVLSRLLLDIGVEVIVAKDGKEAVKQTKEHQPDIVFMDMRMPVMRGEDAVKLICEEFGKDRIKLVAITASTLDQRRDFYLELGCHEYISKPFLEEEVFSSLEELLNVEFVYEDNDTAQDKPAQLDELDFTRMSISEDLYGKLKNSAELYNVTNLEKYLTELEKGDEAPKQLSEHLKCLANSYNMEAILKILESVSKT